MGSYGASWGGVRAVGGFIVADVMADVADLREAAPANARLIAAAPEMKEALEELGGWFDGPADWSDSDLGNWVRKHLWRKVAPILRKATLPASGGAS